LVQIFSYVRILFCTLTEVQKLVRTESMRDEFLGRITIVIVDEAGAQQEWQAALIEQLPAVQRVIIVGDIKQLPPFSSTKEDKTPRGFLERVKNQFARYKMPVSIFYKAIPKATGHYPARFRRALRQPSEIRRNFHAGSESSVFA